MTKAEKVLEYTKKLERQTAVMKGDVTVKYKTLSYYKDVEELASYRIPMDPIDISEDKTEFRCPRCKTKFIAEEGTVDSFDICYECGQLFKELERNDD